MRRCAVFAAAAASPSAKPAFACAIESTTNIPTATKDSLLVRVKCAGANRADILQRDGKYPVPAGESPTLGLEVAGEVVATENESRNSEFAIGDRVFGLVGGGAFAELCALDAKCAVKMPDKLSFEQAAAIPEAYMTAYQALVWIGKLDVSGSGSNTAGSGAGADSHVNDARIRQRKTVLIHAGASGVGLAALQIAAAAGANVICTVGRPEKQRATEECFARVAAKAHPNAALRCLALDRREGEFLPKVLDATEGRGVDILLDFVGADYWAQNVQCLNRDSTMVLLGLLSGPKAPAFNMAPILMKRISIVGSTLRSRSIEYKRSLTRDVSAFLLDRIEAGVIEPNVYKVLPFDEINEAFRIMEANENIGKVVLRIDE